MKRAALKSAALFALRLYFHFDRLRLDPVTCLADTVAGFLPAPLSFFALLLILDNSS